jgi:hypothetical protein
VGVEDHGVDDGGVAEADGVEVVVDGVADERGVWGEEATKEAPGALGAVDDGELGWSGGGSGGGILGWRFVGLTTSC